MPPAILNGKKWHPRSIPGPASTDVAGLHRRQGATAPPALHFLGPPPFDYAELVRLAGTPECLFGFGRLALHRPHLRV